MKEVNVEPERMINDWIKKENTENWWVKNVSTFFFSFFFFLLLSFDSESFQTNNANELCCLTIVLVYRIFIFSWMRGRARVCLRFQKKMVACKSVQMTNNNFPYKLLAGSFDSMKIGYKVIISSFDMTLFYLYVYKPNNYSNCGNFIHSPISFFIANIYSFRFAFISARRIFFSTLA